MQFNVSPVYYANYKAYLDQDVKIAMNQGGTRSGKTYNIIILLITIALIEPRKQITIVGLSVPHLKMGAQKDFIEIMQNYNLYSDSNFNKTDRKYTFPNGSYIEFIAIDQPGKARGPGRDILYVNEANLIIHETFVQLLVRTRGKVFIDFNPSDEYHWLYTHVETRDDCQLIKSTYLDNYDFLPIEQVKEIERLKDLDENYWRVYGLGERGISKATIYTHWQLIDEMPENLDDFAYGIDFGYNNPSAIVKVGFKDNASYVEELLYESHLTNTDLIERAKKLIDKRKLIYPDIAEKDRVTEFSRARFRIGKTIKDVKAGIVAVKGRPLYITKASLNLIKEIQGYKYKVDNKTDQVLDEPVKHNDHLMDALRYVITSYHLKPQRSIRTTLI